MDEPTPAFTPIDTIPVELALRAREAAVMGADEVVASKLLRLLQAKAHVTLYTCDMPLCAPVAELREAHPVRLVWRHPQPSEWDRYALIFASPHLPELCGQLYAWSRQRARPFCAIDRPEECTFVNPAAFSAGGLRLRIFSGGVAPGLSRRLRQDLQAALDTDEMRRFVAYLAALRARTPRAERARVMSAAVQDFRLEARACYPAWVQQGRSGPDREPQ